MYEVSGESADAGVERGGAFRGGREGAEKGGWVLSGIHCAPRTLDVGLRIVYEWCVESAFEWNVKYCCIVDPPGMEVCGKAIG